MSLHIVVCVKNTPASTSVPIDGATGKIKREGLTMAMNPFDEYAVEEAVRWKEKLAGSTVTALTVGPDSSDAVLREAISRGADAGVLITAPGVDELDAYAVSGALAAAVKKLGAEKPVLLVLFGKNTNDQSSGVVGAQTAAWLDWPGVSAVKKIEELSESHAVVWRTMEDGVDILKVTLPAALATVKEINEPRLPSLKGKMGAKKAVIPKWGAAELGLDAGALGEAAAPTTLSRLSSVPSRTAGMRIEGATSAEKAKKLVDVLFERKLI